MKLTHKWMPVIDEDRCSGCYSEVMAMEQELIADGMPVEEIQGMCTDAFMIFRPYNIDTGDFGHSYAT